MERSYLLIRYTECPFDQERARRIKTQSGIWLLNRQDVIGPDFGDEPFDGRRRRFAAPADDRLEAIERVRPVIGHVSPPAPDVTVASGTRHVHSRMPLPHRSSTVRATCSRASSGDTSGSTIVW